MSGKVRKKLVVATLVRYPGREESEYDLEVEINEQAVKDMDRELGMEWVDKLADYLEAAAERVRTGV